MSCGTCDKSSCEWMCPLRVSATNGRVSFMVIWDTKQEDIAYFNEMFVAYIISQLEGCNPKPVIYGEKSFYDKYS